MSSKTGQELRLRRHARVRRTVAGTPERPRVAVFRSNKHIYAQLIDDTTHRTLATASSLEPNFTVRLTEGRTKTDKARGVGQVIGERARQLGIQRVVFDRGGYKYHGRVKAVAEGARAAGLDF